MSNSESKSSELGGKVGLKSFSQSVTSKLPNSKDLCFEFSSEDAHYSEDPPPELCTLGTLGHQNIWL